MSVFKSVILITVSVLLIGIAGYSEKVSAQTCLHSGCKQKCYMNDRYCYKHRIDPTTKKSSKSTKNSYKNSSKSRKNSELKYSSGKKNTTKKSYYNDDMPDCDDYENWGEFMDNWDGFMPDDSDASDYWDNW